VAEGRRKGQKSGKGAPIHLAVAAIYEITGYRPKKQVEPDVIEALGTDFDMERLQKCHKEWLLRGGTNPFNYKIWLFDWYAKGEIPEQGGKHGKFTARKTDADKLAETFARRQRTTEDSGIRDCKVIQ